MNIAILIETIHNSISLANEDHVRWTGGWWLQAYGVEGFLVSRIADGIMNSEDKNRPGFLTLETPFAQLYKDCGLPRGRPTKYTKGNNRIDIALYHKNEKLSHVLEVKRFWSPACKDDLLRLSSFYKQFSCALTKGSLREAIFIQLIYVRAKRNPNAIETQLNKYFESIEERCEKILKNEELSGLPYRGMPKILAHSDGSKEAFSSFCLRLRSPLS